MKLCLLVLLVVALAGCAAKLPENEFIPGPSLLPAQAGVSDAQGSVKEAKQSADKIGDGLGRIRSKAQRIEAKAVVILENWDTVK